MKKTKKLTALLTAACIGGTMILPVCAEPVIGGDINGDGNADVTDVVMLAAHVKSIKALDSEQLFAADINVDGEVDITDLMVLTAQVKNIRAEITDLDTILGMVTKFIDENELEAYAKIMYDDEIGRKVVYITIDNECIVSPVSPEREQRRGQAALNKMMDFVEKNNIDTYRLRYDLPE
ncbi:dockerin type I repeat-containing protein [Ruminococcus sp.]|uniref:dockerin type I repeat-containing protein n=1 Tax=Ruminococcus sp. TaxID=41978 RepID=UPI0025D00032|nr:dockerin type I repeat-containing protein [Ruminococcus sp.]MBQ8964979.1 dockerin type I repeat-containing protein [Ruminococcus sp.]